MEGLNEYLVTSYVTATARQVTKAMALALSQKARPDGRPSPAKADARARAPPQEGAAAEMRRARAARRAAAVRVAAGAAGEGDADALVERLMRDNDAAQPLWPPSERARLMRARQWTCLLARDAAGVLVGWCAPLALRTI